MAYTLNGKIKDLKPYDPISGDYRIRLDANESFVPFPYTVMTGILEKTAFMPYNRYPDPMAEDVCKAFAKHYGVDPANVTAGNGSDELISVILSSFLMKGDKMITLSPDFSMYRFYASIVEADCIAVQKDEDLNIDVDGLIETCNRNGAKLVIFSNPCNPTSLGLKREEVRKLAASVDALVVLDEAYIDFWDQSLLGEVCEYDNLIILRTCSKAFGMAAVRLGFAVTNKVLTNTLKAVKSPYNVNSLSQMVGTAVMSQPGLIDEALGQILESRDALYQGMKGLERNYPEKLKIFETCTNFVFARVQGAKAVYQKLLEKSIAVRLMGDYVRITAGSEPENKELLKRLEEILAEG